ncbi:MAG TPA: pitrilysin family protein [Phycisphaerales bacterium]|nr:pitrilysin family protein [Phycisphaerales bacterium]
MTTTITTRTLRCGMPLIVEPMSGVRSAAMCWLLPAGSAYDPADKEGLSTMWAELLLRGAGPRSSREHADAADRLGASRATELGTYTMRVGSTMLGERFLDTLPLIVDMVLRPRMDEDAVEPCRDLALQSLASLKDDPQERAMLLARSRHHAAPFNRSGMGTEEGLNSLSREDLADGWSSLAKPGRAIFAAAGAVDPDAIERALNDLLNGWSGNTEEPRPTSPPTRGYAHETDESNQVQIILAHDAPPEPAPECVLERLAVSVLSGGMSGRLFSEVREKRGLCYSVSAGYRADRDYGVVTAYVGTTPERAQESLDVLVGELNRLNEGAGAVTPDEFKRAKVGMKSGLVFSGESTGSRAVALASDQRKLGRPRSLEELARQIDAVTLDQLNGYLATRRLGKVTIQTLGPRELKSPV